MEYIKSIRHFFKEALYGDHYHDFSAYELKQATQQYIPLQIDRLVFVEGQKHYEKSMEKLDVIEYFKKNGFIDKTSLSKFHLIFANAGMGKTTFMLNLFQEYTSGILNLRGKGHKMKLFTLAKPSTTKMVSRIKDKEGTILMLDGFDEDAEAIIDFRKRFLEIYNKTKKFYKVILTSRKNLFCSNESQSFENYILGEEKDKKAIKLACTYLSPISVEDVAHYVSQSYSLKEKHKRRQVSEFINQSELLMDRPILLSYIGDLMDGGKKYRYSYQVYETLVNNWIEKEDLLLSSEKNRWSSKDERKAFYRSFAIATHQKQRGPGGLTLDKEEFAKIGASHTVDIETFKLNSKSLINYNAETEEYKFAHRSILEYFLAREAFDNPDFLMEKPFIGRDEALQFFQDMILEATMAEVEKGTLMIESGYEAEEVQIKKFYISKYPVKVSEFRRFCERTGREMPQEPTWGWQDNAPIVNVSWHDTQDYCNWLSEMTGFNYRLPTAKEWELAAGSTSNERKNSDYAGGNKLEELGWFIKNSGRKTHEVGQKKPNKIGVYDLCGNVWEWCQSEIEHVYINGHREYDSVKFSLIKGGCWLNDKNSCKVSNHGRIPVKTKKNMIGFRVIIAPMK
ncbi:MAG: SUMF1/EgtB/PvdO family nonheme iron enzyme [Bacteroidetes bacterium]|nr:SUMF1/EgtB/PvdO family nonheme iron enzyme [Bacteroidota bacterium]